MKNMKCVFVSLLVLSMNLGCFSQQKMETLVLIDGFDSLSIVTKNYLLPYLDHFGIAYELADIKTKKLTRDAGDYSLIIIGPNMKKTKSALKLIKKIQAKGAGVVSFDPDWLITDTKHVIKGNGKQIYFNTGLYITALHEKTDTIKNSQLMPLRYNPKGRMNKIVFADGLPLILVKNGDKNRCVIFTP